MFSAYNLASLSIELRTLAEAFLSATNCGDESAFDGAYSRLEVALLGENETTEKQWTEYFQVMEVLGL